MRQKNLVQTIRVMLLAALVLGVAPALRAQILGVDLAVSSITPPTVESPVILVEVTNLGYLPSDDDVEVELWFDSHSLGRYLVEELLQPGTSVIVEFPEPDRLPGGKHTLIAEVDPGNTVRELSETNNRHDLIIWIDGTGQVLGTDNDSTVGGERAQGGERRAQGRGVRAG